ncbi:MAG: ATP-binding cassette domain-containing protein, partial [Frankia sp.]|nr:ATP-binding cassette domain-containing protein [Frankia sp.]
MGVLEVAHVGYTLPNGHVLLDDVSFRVGDGHKVALIGANGTGKTTLLRILAGDLKAPTGTITVDGRLGVMRQFIGSISDERTVRDFLLGLSPASLQHAAHELDSAELAMMERDDERTSMRYAHALALWGDAHGYDAEVLWDTCTVAAIGLPYDKAQHRLVRTLSGGEQK